MDLLFDTSELYRLESTQPFRLVSTRTGKVMKPVVDASGCRAVWLSNKGNNLKQKVPLESLLLEPGKAFKVPLDGTPKTSLSHESKCAGDSGLKSTTASLAAVPACAVALLLLSLACWSCSWNMRLF
jgi:hypothetical protein